MAWDVTVSQLNAHRAIEARIKSEWVNGASLRTPIQFPAVLRLLSTDGTTMIDAPISGQPWMKVDVINGDTDSFSRCGDHGMNKVLVIVQLSIYSPRQKGMGALLQLAGYAKAIFSRKFNADGLQPGASSFRESSEAGSGWLRGIIQTPVEFFEEVVG